MFKFKQFSINQDKTAMKVGTDGVLLGAWIDVNNKFKILDVGTGTGLITLMITQRNQNASVLGIDIDELAYNQAKENVERSLWSDRIEIKHCSFQEFSLNSNEKFDLIVSNLPFFRNSQKTPQKTRTIARHTDTLPIDDFLSGCFKLLNKEGSFGIIFPYIDYEYFRAKAISYNFFETKRMVVYPTPEKPPVRILSEWKFTKSNELFIEDMIIEQYGRHLYSEKYVDLTKEFYLKM